MTIVDIEKQEVKDKLLELGFQKEERTFWGSKEVFYCWYEGKKRKGREAPTIMISDADGTINYWMNSSYIMREIPGIIIILLEIFTIEE